VHGKKNNQRPIDPELFSRFAIMIAVELFLSAIRKTFLLDLPESGSLIIRGREMTDR
jgi:hypothetical protein